MNFEVLHPLDKSQLVLDAVAKKQQLIGANIANVNTPGYVRRDVSFNQILSTANSPLETKLSEAIGPNPFFVQEEGQVDVKQELIDMQRNMLYYTVATRRVSSVITQLRSVTQVGK
ncbi:MAG: flagellar basal body protein [Candidatus Gastranaerophilales bacterium]|nr:flagellar basal body protein [Candidatus Gastranaerophilales bacterium]